MCREIDNMKDVIIKHMNLTETITNAAKAGRKSYLEVENGKLAAPLLKKYFLEREIFTKISDLIPQFDFQWPFCHFRN